MRLRNIPRAEGVLNESEMVIKNPENLKGRWASEIFKNRNPIHIEIGMGKGQFILELSRRNPNVNYIGIERYSSVLLRAVEKTDEADDSISDERAPAYEHASSDEHTPAYERASSKTQYTNLRFLCFDAAEIANIFASGEVSRIYLNFSDPWPKARHARRRLTSSEFLARYDKILAADGSLEFKTDNRELFDFSVSEIEASRFFDLAACTFNLHHDETMNQGNIMTEYEAKFSSMNHPICKLIAKHR